jgi:hypothetical protein
LHAGSSKGKNGARTGQKELFNAIVEGAVVGAFDLYQNAIQADSILIIEQWMQATVNRGR